MTNISDSKAQRMTNFRWVMCALLFVATTVNYLDRQVLSLTWKDFISVDFGWSDSPCLRGRLRSLRSPPRTGV